MHDYGYAEGRDYVIEQPTRHSLAINRKTTTELGIAIPQDLLFHAGEVIK